MQNLKNILLGKPLRNSQLAGEKLSRLWGLPIMSSDAVSSVAYAVEEILLVLVPIGGYMAFNYAPFVVIPIILLLLILAFSYAQIIDHYPNGGGAYIVSRENLGKFPALLAASALIVDYIMTVAVSISSSTAAIVSAVPGLEHYKVWISVCCVFLVTFGNLRGIREASRVFGLPTYIFIGSMTLMIIVGFIRLLTGSLHPMVYTPAQLATIFPKDTMQGIGLLLLLKAFASGCSALTGVEAVSNAVPSFTAPSQKHAKQILFMLAGVIIFIFGGTSILAMSLRVIPMPNSSVTLTSQIAQAVFGNSFMFYMIQIFTSLILLLAANTAYNGLPLLLSILAHDGFVPRQFSHRGSKLSFSNGIMFICVVSSLLIIGFRSDTHRLIPLYAVGVFISFTLSQYGMVIKWRKVRDRGWQYKMLINAFGAVITAIGTVVVFSEKFSEGAWMLAIAIPAIVLLMYYVKRHYDFVNKQLEISSFRPYYRKEVAHSTQCVVLVHSISKALLKSLNYANTISQDITALHICRHPEHAEELRHEWDKLNIPVRLDIILTQYRDIVKPLDVYIGSREQKLDHGENLSVIITKFISEHWYDNILHNQTPHFLERILSRHKNVSTIIIPFYYDNQHDFKYNGESDGDDVMSD
ncbi:MAG: APC family permease [Clostridia bacterium]|nr:APC family permease [Clostridia bacterium]